MEPGLIGGEINALLARHKAKGGHEIQYKIGPDPSSIDSCMIGGMVANNSSGMCCGVSQNVRLSIFAASLRLHQCLWQGHCIIRMHHMGPPVCATQDRLLPRYEIMHVHSTQFACVAERYLTVTCRACADIPYPSGYARGVPGRYCAGHRRPSQQGGLPEGEAPAQAPQLLMHPSWGIVQH